MSRGGGQGRKIGLLRGLLNHKRRRGVTRVWTSLASRTCFGFPVSGLLPRVSRTSEQSEHVRNSCELPLAIRSSDSVEPAAPQDNLRHRPTRTCDADAHKTKRRSRSTTQDCLRIPWAHSTATAIFWPDVQWAPTWHAKYTVPAVSSWASYTLA